MNIARRTLLLGAAAMPLASCTALFPKAPPETYDLRAPSDVKGLGGGTSAQILILEPTALKSLNSQSIVVKPDPAIVEYLGKAQWTDTLPKVVQAKLVETFENTGNARAVAKPGEGLVIDYQIVSDIRAFEAQMDDGSGTAVISISVKLVSDASGTVRRTKVFSAQSPISGKENLEIVSALNTAFDKIARDIARWVFSAI